MPVNAMKVSPHDAYDVLFAGYEAHRDEGLKQCFMLHGEPGVGKSYIVQRLADAIGAKLYDIRLTTIDIADLRGLPYYNHKTKQTEYYTSTEMPAKEFDENGKEKWSIFFLDEITAAPLHLVPSVYGIMQERRLGGFVFPENCIIIAAGNGVSDGAIANEMGTALANRLTHMTVVQTAQGWIDFFAIPNKIDPAVIATISQNPGLIHNIQQCIDEGNIVSCTGRSWEMVSNIRQKVKGIMPQMVMIAGRVGQGPAEIFHRCAANVDASVDILELFNAPRKERVLKFATNQDALMGMVFGILGHVNEENMGTAIEIFADLAILRELRPDADLGGIQLSELATTGFDQIIIKALEFGMSEQFSSHPAYVEYHERRREKGLTRQRAA